MFRVLHLGHLPGYQGLELRLAFQHHLDGGLDQVQAFAEVLDGGIGHLPGDALGHKNDHRPQNTKYQGDGEEEGHPAVDPFFFRLFFHARSPIHHRVTGR